MATSFVTTPIKKDDLLEFVHNQDDFALELFVYRSALEEGYQAVHGGSYSDRVTGISRQFDVRAGISLTDNVRIELAIECKCLKPHFPLLVSRIPRSLEESFNEVIIRPNTQDDPSSMDGLKRGYPQVLRFVEGRSLYPALLSVGKSTAQVGRKRGSGNEPSTLTSNDSEVFEKWGQALASANDLIQDALKRGPYPGRDQANVAVFPILVVSDETLWVADYDETGHLINDPLQINSAEIFVGEKYSIHWYGSSSITYAVSHLHVFTKSGIVEFLKTLVHGPFSDNLKSL
ncbi:hypothetical protein [Massilia sp. Root351]|jgi:hypothetical protein|uniref:hypothetical protein n=1 Tax=Massilia sp. Root351 TaxID=1736522 RepID=UPI000A4F7D2E|nr:hypothetical protein [Massilia sp. Root351]